MGVSWSAAVEEREEPGGEGDSLDGLAAVARELEGAAAGRIIAWATGRFGQGLVLSSSFNDSVLIDLAVAVDPSVEVVFLDTGYHFPETLDYVEAVRDRYDLNLRVIGPDPAAAAVRCGDDGCCDARKVAPLGRALEGRSAWMTGIRRSETPQRSAAPVVALDPRWEVVKVNPLVSWSDDDVERYVDEHGLLVHPLARLGYGSIGCAPTTSPVRPGEDPRAGRWPGQEKTECGLHW